MSQVDLYLDASERANIRRSYASAIQHFEVKWGGLLPATIDSIARYLAVHYSAAILELFYDLSKKSRRLASSRPPHAPPANIKSFRAQLAARR